jgi:hypothetical protein
MSCTLEFDECLIEGRCGPSSGGGGGGGGRTCDAQPGGDWLATFGGVQTQQVLAVAIDACDGDVVVVGDMNEPLTVYPAGDSVAAIGGAWDMFVARFTADGTLRFAKSFGSRTSTGEVRVRDVAIDDLGNAVVVGGFTGTVDFGAESTTSKMAQSDAFVASYSRDGEARWLLTFGGDLQDSANAVTIDPIDGTIWVTGEHSPSATFFGETPGGSSGDVFVLRMTPDGEKPGQGEFLWRLGGANTQIGQAIEVDAERAYVAGTFLDEIDPLVEPSIPGDLGSNAFVAAFAKDGANVWLNTIMDDSEEADPHLALAFGSLMVSTNINGPISTACGTHMPMTGAIVMSGFAPSDGSCAAWEPIGGVGDDLARGLAINTSGDLVLAGTYTADLVTPSLPAEDTADIFAVALSSELVPLTPERINANGLSDDVAGIAFGPAGDRLLVGRFSDRITQNNDIVTTDGAIDGFVMSTAP